jgi:hypothetical protein
MFAFAMAPFTWCQSDRGTITGVVSDDSGGMLSGVAVVATQTATGVEFKAITNNLGYYTIVELPIGYYKVQFSKAGFMDLVRPGIQVQTQHTVPLNAAMKVGTVTETVTVTGTPALEIQTEVGTNMNAQELTDLPLSANGGRDITSFAFAVTPNVSGSSWATNVGGSQAFTKSVMIDGTSTDSGIVGQVAESEPSMDAIQEAQVDTTGLRAEDGRSGGGAFMYEMKSGTNVIHGSAFGLLANEFLNANTWDNKWWGVYCGADASCNSSHPSRRAKNRYNDYGFSGGGPIWKKEKMFVFGAFERYTSQDWSVNPTGGTVPTTKMLNGDFSEMYAAAATARGTSTCTTSPCPIMNGTVPFKDAAGNTVYYGSIISPSGNVYANNIITDPLSAMAKKITAIYARNYAPTGPGVVGNYPSLKNSYPNVTHRQYSLKYDYELRRDDHVAISFINTVRFNDCPGSGCGNSPSSALWQAGTKTGGPLVMGERQRTIANSYRGSETHTFSPNMVNVAAYTFNQFQNISQALTSVSDSTNWPSQLGLGSIDPAPMFPMIQFSGSPNGLGETTIGQTKGISGYVAYNAILNESLNWSKGRHAMKYGMEYRALGFNSDNHRGALQYNFTNTSYTQNFSSQQGYVGSAFANFLLGEVQSASQGVDFFLNSRRKEISFFVQDDIRINSKLNVSADVRWELTRPLHVLGGKWSNFDTTATSQAFFNADGTGVKGAITWLAHPNDSFETYNDWHQIGPKVGASYQLTNKMVARVSAGINFVPLGWNGYSGTPYGSAVGFSGSNQVNQVSVTTPAFQWDTNAYPGVIVAPTGPQPKSTYVPWGVSSVDRRSHMLGMTENYYAGVQYELPKNTRIEVSYMLNFGRNLHDGGLVPQNYPTWNTYHTALMNACTDNNHCKLGNWVGDSNSATSNGVTLPYPGWSGPAWAALNPFPQVYPNSWAQIAFTDAPLGQSSYNGITVEAVKQHGNLNMDLSYNWSRSTGNTGSAFIDTWSFSHGYQDPYNYRKEATWPYRSFVVKGYVSYGLPFGKGQRFLADSRLVNYAVGGWTVSTVVNYSEGGQMGPVGSTNNYPGWSGVYTDVVAHPDFGKKFKTLNLAWNPTAANAGADPNSLYFNTSNFTNPVYGQLGNSPSTFTNWHGWPWANEDFSLLKKNKIGKDGRYSVTLRAEFFDFFNRHHWGGPNTSMSSAYYGHVTGVSGNRTGQVGARFEW